jgi:hypothetical protein
MKLYGKLEEKYSKASTNNEDIPSAYNYTKLSNTKKFANNARIFGQG